MPASHFSTSTSSFRASQSQMAPTMSYSDNTLTQLPSVDFDFGDLRKRMADFTLKFDAYIERGRKRVLEERNEFRARLGELGGKRGLSGWKQATNTYHRRRGTAIDKHSNHYPPIYAIYSQPSPRAGTSRKERDARADIQAGIARVTRVSAGR